MVISFQSCEAFGEGLSRVLPILGVECGEGGYSLRAEQADFLGASLSGKEGVIYYKEKIHFFRALGLFVEKARLGGDFEVRESLSFDTVGMMFDTSRFGGLKLSAIKEQLDYLALMGYNLYMLYTEDSFDLPGRPHFGYMRPRYTEAQLRELDDYAYAYGIEMIPCFEAYGHMSQYLAWDEAAKVKDTASVLLAEEEETYKLLEEMIVALSKPFRSKRIHIGMDEAWDMGRGKYLDRHGLVPLFDIFNRHMDRLIAITNKHGLKPMMWSDMYFRIASGGTAYYDESIVVPDSVKEKIPEGVEMVYWHYGEGPKGCDDYMLEKHQALGHPVIYAAGLWSWIGHAPENHYTYETTKAGIAACNKHGVRQMMTTYWTNDGSETQPNMLLLALSFTAEMAYKGADVSEDVLRARFEALTGGDYDAFWDMSAYQNDFDSGKTYENFHDRFYGKAMFWQDIMQGIYDKDLWEQPLAGHYAAYAKKMSGYDGKWKPLYAHMTKVFDYLATKTLIAENLKPAYDRGDREVLAEIKDKLLPALLEKTVAVHESHRKIWRTYYMDKGWRILDDRYGAMKARIATAIEQLGSYLSGEVEALDELAEPRYHRGVSGFQVYRRITAPVY